MFTIIDNVLSKYDIQSVKAALSSGAYTDGAETAGPAVKHLKKNIQTYTQDAAQIIYMKLIANEEFQRATFLKVLGTPMFSIYLKDMEYGPHTDDAVMRKGHLVFRSDLAITLFLNDPQEYEGGELCINVGQQHQTEFKLPAGSLLIYPADTVHCVNPVTHGFRQVMVTWAQSMIRNHDQREILFKLLKSIDNPESATISHLYTKLARMWADI